MPMSKVAVLVVEDVPQVRATAVRIMETSAVRCSTPTTVITPSRFSRLTLRSRFCSRMSACPA